MDDEMTIKLDGSPSYRTEYPIECKHGITQSICVYESEDSEDYVYVIRHGDDSEEWYVTSDYSDIELIKHDVY